MDPVSLHNFAVVGVVANCAMGLFREIIASLINEFVPSFPTQLPSRRCRGELHYGTVWRRHHLFAKRIWTQFPYATSQSSVVANCTMGLFGDVITSSIDLSRIYLGCQRLFSRCFRFLCGFGQRPKMCRPSANTENSRRTREKPQVPRVSRIPL